LLHRLLLPRLLLQQGNCRCLLGPWLRCSASADGRLEISVLPASGSQTDVDTRLYRDDCEVDVIFNGPVGCGNRSSTMAPSATGSAGRARPTHRRSVAADNAAWKPASEILPLVLPVQVEPLEATGV
jgi:hypothetical protein